MPSHHPAKEVNEIKNKNVPDETCFQKLKI
jgi:hypothetical protein